jgi:hypothetical protein
MLLESFSIILRRLDKADFVNTSWLKGQAISRKAYMDAQGARMLSRQHLNLFFFG